MSDAKLDVAGGSLRRFKPYPEYKDSGVDWLGKVPQGWSVMRLRSSVTGCQNGVWGDEPDGVHDLPCVRVADFDRIAFRVRDVPTLRLVDHRIVAARGLQPGDLLLEKSGGGENQTVGAVVLYEQPMTAVCSNFIARMTVARGFSPRFLTYLYAAMYSLRVNTRSIKQSTGIQNLDSDSYLRESAAFPNIREQRAIAAFLDRETARIDALVAKNERLIELLQEKRNALITRAVTKGLDPDVPMKDSGLEWLGEIPAHWQVTKMWDATNSVSGGTPKDEPRFWHGGIPWVSPKDMKRRLIDSSEDTVSPAAIEAGGLKLIQNPAVLIVVRGMILAHSFPVALTMVPVTINQDMKALRLRNDFDPEYFTYWLNGVGRNLRALLVEEAAHGTKVIRMDKWRVMSVEIPPKQEQRGIVTFLDSELAKMDRLIGKIHQAIGRLQELRSALISAAVTGKIDVREVVA